MTHTGTREKMSGFSIFQLFTPSHHQNVGCKADNLKTDCRDQPQTPKTQVTYTLYCTRTPHVQTQMEHLLLLLCLLCRQCMTLMTHCKAVQTPKIIKHFLKKLLLYSEKLSWPSRNVQTALRCNCLSRATSQHEILLEANNVLINSQITSVAFSLKSFSLQQTCGFTSGSNKAMSLA